MAVALLPTSLLLLLLSPALGNEGAAAGSCNCRRESEEPPIVRKYPHRLQSCQTCLGSIMRFMFPKTNVCGHETDDWARSFWDSSCNKTQVRLPEDTSGRPAMRVEAPRPQGASTPAPCTTVPVETSGPVQGTPENTPRAEVTPDRAMGAPWGPGRARSTPPAGGDPVGAGPSWLSLQEEVGPRPSAEGSRVAVLALIGVALASAAVATLVVCRRRCGGRHSPSGPPGEEARYLPCPET